MVAMPDCLDSCPRATQTPATPPWLSCYSCPCPPWESSRPGPRSREDTSSRLPFLFLSLRLFKNCFETWSWSEVSGQEESFKHVTEKMALPGAHVAGMLPKAYDTEKMSPGDHVSTPASLPPGPGFRPLRSPWGQVAGPVALYGGWRARESEGSAGGLGMLQSLHRICLGTRHGWTVPERR